jgi:hypothetical protein
MKIEVDLECCSKEMVDAFSSHLEKYGLSLGNVLEEFIFSMDRSDRLYDRSQDEAWLAEGFFDRAVLNNHGLDFESYEDFIFAGEIFNEDFLNTIKQDKLRQSQSSSKNEKHEGRKHGLDL